MNQWTVNSMTPNHQQVVDNTLRRMDARLNELMRHCRMPSKKPPGETPIEQLRETLLGEHLAAIAHYVEGYAYPYEGDLRASAGFVTRCIYGEPLATRGFRLPPKWQRTDLGKLVHTAMLHFYERERPGQLLTVTEVRTLFGVKRQTVHQWMEDGVLFGVYRGDTPLFYRKEVIQLQEKRAHNQHGRNVSASGTASTDGSSQVIS
jgi:hypothetical protein